MSENPTEEEVMAFLHSEPVAKRLERKLIELRAGRLARMVAEMSANMQIVLLPAPPIVYHYRPRFLHGYECPICDYIHTMVVPR